MRCFKQLIIISLEVNLGIYFGTLVTLHVICDVIGIALYLSKNPRWRPCVFFLLCQTLKSCPVDLYLKTLGINQKMIERSLNEYLLFEFMN